MKNLLLFLTLFSLVTITKAQNDFAPIGAKWIYYQQGSPLMDQVTSIADTLIQNKPCKILKPSFGICAYNGKAYMYSDSGKVYFFDWTRDSFQLLFDINANVGEQFSFKTSNDSVVTVVDSISTININGHILKKLFTHHSHIPIGPTWSNGREFIENIGDTHYMFPNTCSEYCPGPLGCYSDSVLGSYAFDTFINCATVSIHEPTIKNALSIFPNPSNGKFTLQIDDAGFMIYNLKIYNVLGEVIIRSEVRNVKSEINIKDAPAGIYFLQLQTAKEIIRQKIIVE